MSRVEINAHGRHVIVDHDGELEPLQRTARELWEVTGNAGPERLGPAFGFQAPARYTPDIHPTGHGARSRPTAPVVADQDPPR
nr:hypothetical protein [Micromonospora sp. DSM 115978]